MAGEQKSTLESLDFPQEIDEEVNIVSPGTDKATKYSSTDWPRPVKRLRLVMESPKTSIEEPYFWIVNHLKTDQSYREIIKITDSMTASENSSMFGVQVQRLNIQQDKAAQYMGTIANMVKSLFQIVREIRVMKERLAHYHGSLKGNKSSDIALKGYWVDLVEGGGKSPASIYGLAQQLGFNTLPDLFFETMVVEEGDVDKTVEERAGQFNRKVKEVLKRKLQQYIIWRKETRIELETRHKFTLRYLRQHWNTIRMYMGWVKPMLKNVRRLQTSEKFRENPEILSSMEGAMMEVEVLAKHDEIKGYYPVTLVHFLYRVRPHMNFNNEYQRGPVHVGRVAITFRSYAWTQEEIDNYVKLRQEEDFELLGMVDTSIQDAMEALGDELKKYLREAEEEIGIAEEKNEDITPVAGPSILEPFTSLFGGFRDAFRMVVPKGEGKKKVDGSGKKIAAKVANTTMFLTYKFFKKSHRMMAW